MDNVGNDAVHVPMHGDPRVPAPSSSHPAWTTASTSAVHWREAGGWRERPTPGWLGRISPALPPSRHSFPQTESLSALCWLRPSLPQLLPLSSLLSSLLVLVIPCEWMPTLEGFLQNRFQPSTRILIRGRRKVGTRMEGDGEGRVSEY